MKTLGFFLTLIGMFISVIILDYLWLGIITKKFIISQFGSLIKLENGNIKINLSVGLITWMIIALGCLVFVVMPSETIKNAIMFGALFGFVTYSIYDLTNLTFISNYPIKFTLVDIVWGTIICSLTSGIGFYLKNYF